jgi:tetratricopeptide (TPR) repeat protein
VIETARWWNEGDWLYYDSAAGSIGIPRSIVLRIEKSEVLPKKVDAGSRVPPRETPARRTPGQQERLAEQMQLGNQALQSRDFESSAAHFLDVVQMAPEIYSARIGYAVSQIALGQDGLALSVVLDGLSREPGRPELHEVLGDLRNREERVEDALRSWQEAFRIDPNDRLREKIFKAERELHAARDYDYAHTPHFNLRYDGQVERRLTGEITEYLEDEYRELSNRFRHAPQQPITVLLYPEQQFRDVTLAPDQVGGIYDGKIRVPLGGLKQLTPQARQLLAHELTHAVVHSKTRGHCPRWLHEGLAQMIEGKQLRRSHVAAVREQLGPDPTSWESRGFSYPVALALTRYLEQLGGFDGMVWLLEQLGDGRDLDETLRTSYGYDYAGICVSLARSLEEGDR